MFLLISFVILFACQNSGQQAYKDDIVPIDSTFVVTNDSHEDNVLPDSAKITIISPRLGMDSIVFSINHGKESSIELSYISEKEILPSTYSNQILKKIGDIFLEQKTPVIIAKKYLPEKVASDLPYIRFVIYSNDKTIKNEYFVGKRQNHYEITYSDSFLELYDLLYITAMEVYESKR